MLRISTSSFTASLAVIVTLEIPGMCHK